MKKQTHTPPIPERSPAAYQLDPLEGLEVLALSELRTRYPKGLRIIDEDRLEFTLEGDASQLTRLKLSQIVYSIQHYPIPRPKALLGDAHWRRLIAQIESVIKLSPPGTFRTFTLAAAGTESSVMQRIRTELAARIGLEEAEKGDLWIRLLASASGQGWDSLVRLTPRPLATRYWRVCSYEAALNATAAHAMARLTQPNEDDVYVNLGCGSGTLLIERAAAGRFKHLIGIDHNPQLLACSRKNIEASGLKPITLIRAELQRTPLTASSVSAITADLPFGQNVGSHEENQALYPPILHEAARIAQPGARFVVITHEIRLMEQLLRENVDWTLEQELRITLRGLHPRIYVLVRTSQTS